MKTSLAQLTLISGLALLGAQTTAQTHAPTTPPVPAARAAAEPAQLDSMASAARGPAAVALQTAAAPVKPAQPAGGQGVTRVTAAGSVLILLADGIVANASMAQVAPPAPGFVYER